MESVLHTKLRRATVLMTGVGLIALAGCGDDGKYTNKERPPALIVVPASISDAKVSVSPSKFGAGPVNLIISNQSREAQRVTFRSEDSSGFKQQTGPINPGANAELKVDTTEGTAVVSVSGQGIQEARIDIGPKRASAQNELLQP